MNDFFLHQGGHGPMSGKGCAMEWVGVKWLMSHGYSFTEAWARLDDEPACTDSMITSAVICINDTVNDEDRQRLIPFLDRVQRCHSPSDELIRRRVRTRVACWAARQVLHLIQDADLQLLALRAIETAEAWLRGEATTGDCHAATAACIAAVGGQDLVPETWAAWSAADTTGAAHASTAQAASHTISAISHALKDAETYADALMAFLDELLDRWEKARAEEGALADDPPVPAPAAGVQ